MAGEELTMRHNKVIVVLVVLALLSPLGWRTARAWQAPQNLLKNPGFEGGFFHWSGINEIYVAHDWTPWWRTRTDADPPATYFTPEYKKADGYVYPNRVHSGAAAQQWFTFYSTHQAGMYQQVFGVTPGVRYRFTIWAQVWSSTQDDPLVSFDPAYPNLQIGIDPTGNWSAWDSDVVWSGRVAFYDTWGQLSVEAVAQNDIITVFMRSEPNFSVKHNDMYWDDAVLVAVSGSGSAPPPPPPSQASPTPFAVTCVAPPDDWVTYHVQRGDTLYSLAKSRGSTLDAVVAANCLQTTDIYVGQALLLPPLPASATPRPVMATPVPPTATPNPTQPPTLAPTASPTAVPATLTPTPTSTPTPLPIAVATPTPSSTMTMTPAPPTALPAPTASPLPTSAPTGSSTRPCGTIAVGAGIVLFASVLGLRRRERLV
jgi:LysM repeat protein